MTRAAAIVLALLSACAPVPPQGTPRPDEVRKAFDPEAVRRDLEASARAKFGDALTQQALAAPTFLLAKHYFGLSPPPMVQPDGSYRYPDPPVAMLVSRNGQWLAARAGSGFAPIATDKAAEIERTLQDPAFRKEPAAEQPGCTDAGASLLWLNVSGQRPLVRRGACGATARTERLIFLALDA